VKRFLAAAFVLVCIATSPRTASAQEAGSTQQPAPAQQAPTASTGIVGKWHFVLETPSGDREADAELAVDTEGKVTGTFGTSTVAGTYKDGKLDLDFPFTSDELNETSELKFSGKLDDTSALSGTWEFISYTGTFKATRPKS
jgi:hypothetical protein